MMSFNVEMQIKNGNRAIRLLGHLVIKSCITQNPLILQFKAYTGVEIYKIV